VKIIIAGSDQIADNATIVSYDDDIAEQELERIYNEVVNENKPVIRCFPREVRYEIRDVFPAYIDTDKLVISEFVPFKMSGINISNNNIEVRFNLTTNYTITEKLAVLIGFCSGKKEANGDYIFEWVQMDAEPTVTSDVKVTIEKEYIDKIQNSETVILVVLNAQEFI